MAAAAPADTPKEELSEARRAINTMTVQDIQHIHTLIVQRSSMSVEHPDCRVPNTTRASIRWAGYQLSTRVVIWFIDRGRLPESGLYTSCKTYNCITLAHMYEPSDISANRRVLWCELQAEKSVDPISGCWIRPQDKGKGEQYQANCNVAGRSVLLHRFAFEMQSGQPLTSELCVRHGHGPTKRCISTSCFNPQHLLSGTAKENGEDSARDGTLRGKQAKISLEVATQIKCSEGDGTRKARAIRFGVTTAYVSQIDRGVSWNYVPDKTGKVGKAKSKTIKRPAVWTLERYNQLWKRMLRKAVNRPAPVIKLLLPFEKDCLIIGDGTGYKYIKNNDTLRSARIISYELHRNNCQSVGSRAANGPSHNIVIRHLCGIAGCIEPSHLESGSPSQNGHDTALVGRVGQKLTAMQVLEIKSLLATNPSNSVLATKYNVGVQLIGQIRRGKTWSWLDAHITALNTALPVHQPSTSQPDADQQYVIQ